MPRTAGWGWGWGWGWGLTLAYVDPATPPCHLGSFFFFFFFLFFFSVSSQTFIAGDLSKLDDVLVESVATGAQIPMRTFWFQAPVVVCFLRRFGCQMCRYGCK